VARTTLPLLETEGACVSVSFRRERSQLELCLSVFQFEKPQPV
jgi:hypothetical protein